MNAQQIARLAELGVATVYEASGRQGLLDLNLVQLLPGSRVAGPARTVLCGQDDNLMVHAAVERIQPGEVLVLGMPQPAAVALIGELLAVQIRLRGAAGVLVDAAVRDVKPLRALGLPVWARWIRVRGATKQVVGRLDTPLTVGGAAIHPGDMVVLDADGGVCVPQARAAEVLRSAEARLEKETRLLELLHSGALTYDLHGLREKWKEDL